MIKNTSAALSPTRKVKPAYLPEKSLGCRNVFRTGGVEKLNVRGKVFIEYIPAEHAWIPILAEQYMHINCLWVSGKYKGQGYSDQLLNQCIDDAKKAGKSGFTALSSAKKKPFLSDPGYLKHRGFKTADTADPFYELLYLPFSDDAPVPAFKDCVKQERIPEDGMVIYFTAVSVRTLQNMSLCFKKSQRATACPSPSTKFKQRSRHKMLLAPFTAFSFLSGLILSQMKYCPRTNLKNSVEQNFYNFLLSPNISAICCFVSFRLPELSMICVAAFRKLSSPGWLLIIEAVFSSE